MDVVGNKPGYRRRLHLQTPEINTYQRQIVFCEKKYDTISKKFLSNDSSQDATSVAHHTNRLLSTDPVACDSMTSVNSRKNSMGPYNTRWARRKSSLQLQGSTSKRPSIVSPAIKHTISANQMARRSSSEGAAAARELPNHVIKQKKLIPGGRSGTAKRDASKEQNKDKMSEAHTNTTNEDVDSTSHSLQELKCVLYKEREQFMRALTTLAINRITTDNATPVARNSTFTNYERNIEVLSGSRLSYIDVYNNDHENEKDISTDASSTTITDLYGAVDDENNTQQLDKRHRINQLKNYLQCSGFGEPNVITTTNEQTEEEKQSLARLIRRINRGLSGEKQERLRRKARLDYEMSLMKGESFCEQQEQAYMRTASADMGNRDVQLLEEELKIHALQEIRQNNQKNLKRQDFRSVNQRQSSSSDLNKPHEDGHGNQKNQDGEAGAAEGDEDNPDVDEKSTSDDRDAMSGLISNPLSRREMRKRILMWVYDVEEATGMYSQERDKHDRRHNRSQRRMSHIASKGVSNAYQTVTAADDFEQQKNI